MTSDKFKAWAKAYGVETLALECKVHRSTVYGWIKGTLTPSDPHRLSILKLAGRKLNLMDLFTTTD